MAKLKATTINGSLEVRDVNGTVNSKGDIRGNINASDINVGTVNNDRITKSSTTTQGIVQLNDAVNSTSTSQAATANAVKKANDNANGRLPSGGKAVDSAKLNGLVETNANTANTIVKRDGSGNFSAGTITANLSGNATSANTSNRATTADSWTTARTITLGGDLSGSVSIKGDANVTLSAQVANDSHEHDGRYYTETESNDRFALINSAVQSWNAVVKCATWSRIMQLTGVSTVGHSGILVVRGTRGNVVFNHTFTINTAHASKATIIQIGAADYANFQIRAVIEASGNGYIEIYDNANSATNTTSQTLNINYINISGATLTKYTAWTDGTALPSGYTEQGRITTSNKALVGNLVGNASTSSKWASARTITLGGDLSGSVSIDGSANVTLSGQVADNSHNHTTLNGVYGGAVVLNDHSNGNVTISGSKTSAGVAGDLYVGYNSGNNVTRDILVCRNMKWQANGAILVDANGKIPWSALTGLPSSFTPSSHTHDDRYYTEGESDGRYLYRSADSTLTGKVIGSGSDRTSGIYGTYDSTKIGHIWSMGTSYKVSSDGANFGNLYGLAYKHTNNGTGGTMAGGHQMIWCSNGSPKVALGDNLWAAGGITAGGTISGGTVIVPSRGNRNPDSGRNSFASGVYTYNTTNGNSGAPTTYSSIIGFGRGTSGATEICSEWTSGRGLWVRSLRDVTDNWYGWTRVYTESYRPHTYGTEGPNNSDGRPDGSVYYRYV